jgi:leucyl-tRNA synthetase
MPLQINGKLRATFSVSSKATKEEIEKYIMSTDSLASMFAGKQVRKVIIIPGKIANIVVG